MLTGDEAGIVVLGLMAARRLGLDGENGAAGQALAKISRVLPGPLRSRIEAVQATVGFTVPSRPGAPAAPDAIPSLAEAIWQRQRVRASYQTAAGRLTAREFSPHGLVIHSGYCYLVAYGLECGFTIYQPEELRASVHALARRLSGAADRRVSGRAGPGPGSGPRRPR